MLIYYQDGVAENLYALSNSQNIMSDQVYAGSAPHPYIPHTPEDQRIMLDALGLGEIRATARENPLSLLASPQTTPVGLIDETKAVRDKILTWRGL